jgi:hypothetical protein
VRFIFGVTADQLYSVLLVETLLVPLPIVQLLLVVVQEMLLLATK